MTFNMDKFPVSARRTLDGWLTSGISFDDYARMSVQQHKASGERRLPTPDWSVNDRMLRELLVTFMEERAGLRRKQKGTLAERLERAKLAIIAQRPRLVAVMDKLCMQYVQLKKYGAYPDASDEEILDVAERMFGQRPLLADDPACGLGARQMLNRKHARDWEIEIEGIDTYLRITENGGAGKLVAIVYLYYRTGLDSVGVGAELGLKPPHVRQTLWRLHDTWNKKFASHESGNSAAASKDKRQNSKTDEALTSAGLAAAPLFDSLRVSYEYAADAGLVAPR